MTDLFFSLQELFQWNLSMSAAALPVIAAILAARWVLDRCRAPRKVAYCLWAAAAFRLLCPAALSTRWSLFNLKALSPVAKSMAAPGDGGFSVINLGNGTGVPPALSQPAAPAGTGTELAARGAAHLSASELILRAAPVLWAIGIAAFLLYSAVSCLRLRRRLATATRWEGNVYECEGLPTPFVLGWFRPKIYLPLGMDAARRTYVLCHERIHLRRRDQWWKLLGFAILTLYWWNIAVWLCWLLFCLDMEMSCDEAVLSRLGAEAKREYSLSLMDFAAGRRFSSAVPLAFGECGAKSRIKNVLRWKQARAGAAFLAVSLAAALAVSCCTNATWNNWVEQTGGKVSLHCADQDQTVTLYQEVYQNGVLYGNKVLWVTDGEAARQQAFSIELGWSGGANSSLEWTLAENGTASTVPAELPPEVYRGFATSWMRSNTRYPLENGKDVLVAAFVLDMDGQDTSGYPVDGVKADQNTVLAKSDCVVLVHLYAGTLKSGASVSAQTLYDLRNLYVGDASADGQLLSGLDTADDLGEYTMELFTSAKPYLLQVDLKATPDGAARKEAMFRDSCVLLALIGNLDEVRWVWGGGAELYSLTADQAGDALRASSESSGGSSLAENFSIKDCASSPEQFSALLTLLDAQAKQNFPAA